MQEEIKKSLNFKNMRVLTNLLDHLIIFTKTYDPPLPPPPSSPKQLEDAKNTIH